MAEGHNDKVSAVNTITKYIRPIISETNQVKNSVSLMSEAMQELLDNRDAVDTAIGEGEQAISDLTQEISAVNARAKDAELVMFDVQNDLQDTTELTKSLEMRTEWLDRGQRSHNMIVFGWEPQGSPLEDARQYFNKIGFTLAESFLAHRGPRLLKDGNFRPGVLRITFNSVPTCHRALEAAKIHANGDRTIPFYAKPDRTREQEKLKRAADEGVRIMRNRFPGRDFCERSGKVAEFVANGPDGRATFERFHPIPNADDELMAD